MRVFIFEVVGSSVDLTDKFDVLRTNLVWGDTVQRIIMYGESKEECEQRIRDVIGEGNGKIYKY